ncbi:MAG: response regulator [Marinisporobacter sp.]|jgi:two-component SAPR family response regulator|nr:response regulator [Marinisporobacter sp.]
MLKAVLFDDEKLALKMMQIQLNKVENVKIIGAFTVYDELMKHINKEQADIAFLDIETPFKSGLEIAQEILHISPNTEIVFVTAYKDYAFDAYELEAQDYLLKPVKKERLERVIKKVERLKENSLKHNKDTSIEQNDKLFKINMMNKFQVKDQQGNIIKWRTKKTEELMAFLVHHHDHIVTSDRIIEGLWEDKELEKAKNILYTTIYYLKKILVPRGISFIGNQYSIKEIDFDSDFIQLSNLMKQLENNSSEDIWKSHEIIIFEKIYNLYIGGYLEINAYEWALVKKLEYERRFISLANQGIKYYKAHNNYEKQIELLEKLLEINEYEEKYYEELLCIHKNMNNKKRYEKIKKRYEETINRIKIK